MLRDTPTRIAFSQPGAPRCFRGQLAAHLIADTEAELLRYAAHVVGLKPGWIQRGDTAYAHFALTGLRLRRAWADSAVRKVCRKDFIRIIKSRLAGEGANLTIHGMGGGRGVTGGAQKRLGHGPRVGARCRCQYGRRKPSVRFHLDLVKFPNG
jgi:hypothetical protein